MNEAKIQYRKRTNKIGRKAYHMRRTDGHPKTLREFSQTVKIGGGNRNTLKLMGNFHQGRNYQR